MNPEGAATIAIPENILSPSQVAGREIILDDTAPLRLAENFLSERYTRDGKLLLRRNRDEYWFFNDAYYENVTNEELGAEIYKHVDRVYFRRLNKKTMNYEIIRLDATMRRVNEVKAALPACDDVLVVGEMPQWLTKQDRDPREYVLLKNGILHVPSGIFRPSTPDFFSCNGIDYEYVANARLPQRWLGFLTSLWGEDTQSIETLQEWFGYCLTPDTRQQKMLMIIGPKRSGKGTIARVLKAMLGGHNVAAPTLAGLCTNFGLQVLLDKSLAIIGDARLSGRSDQAIITERLLSISGEDSITIDRKFKKAVTTRLPTRFMLLSNELPRLTDNSGALASRFILLTLHESFLGQEDISLTDRLIEELPGVLCWALDGWLRLKERGRFIQPDSANNALRDLEDLGSPISAFLRDRCQVASGKLVSVSELYGEWTKWCEDIGRKDPGNIHTFGRNLNAAVAGLVTKQVRVPGADNRYRVYEGIALNEKK